MIRHIYQSHPHVINMCQILKSATENLIYHNRLNNNNDLDDIVLNFERYLNKDKIN
jgi:hypothetical protein